MRLVERVERPDVAPKNVKVNSVSGNITLALPDDAGFVATLDSVSGDLTCELAGVVSKGCIVCGSGGAQYKFNSVSGDVRIEKIA